MKRHTLALSVPVAAIIITGAVFWAHAGSLTPPAGPVAPTMKTLDQISADIAALQAPIKQVIRGVIAFPKDQRDASQAVSPTVNPAKCVVLLSDSVATDIGATYNLLVARTGACLASLTSSQITVRVDMGITLVPMEVSYQIIEYN